MGGGASDCPGSRARTRQIRRRDLRHLGGRRRRGRRRAADRRVSRTLLRAARCGDAPAPGLLRRPGHRSRRISQRFRRCRRQSHDRALPRRPRTQSRNLHQTAQRSRLVTGLRCLFRLAASLVLCGCQTTRVPTNEPLPCNAQGMPIYTPGYALLPMLQQPKGEIVFIMAFSGGGKRSAAFAHGVLRGLRQIPVVEDGRTRPLLVELDYIAAVSGGSFPAMHYGLYRDKSFETFPQEFLKADINAYVYGTYLFPWNWEWLVNPFYGTNDRMAEIYDRLMFHGATYADLLRQGLPLISVNATDIANGISYSFTQPSFDLLCSDLSSFPVARAVAASNGFPVLFSPITLTSHITDCRGVRPPTAPPAEWAESADSLSRRALLARIANRYLDP